MRQEEGDVRRKIIWISWLKWKFSVGCFLQQIQPLPTASLADVDVRNAVLTEQAT